MEESVNQTAIISVDGKLTRTGEAAELKRLLNSKVAGSWFCDEIYLLVVVRRDKGLLIKEKENKAINLL